jgi:hypothetical protein
MDPRSKQESKEEEEYTFEAANILSDYNIIKDILFKHNLINFVILTSTNSYMKKDQ